MTEIYEQSQFFFVINLQYFANELFEINIFVLIENAKVLAFKCNQNHRCDFLYEDIYDYVDCQQNLVAE